MWRTHLYREPFLLSLLDERPPPPLIGGLLPQPLPAPRPRGRKPGSAVVTRHMRYSPPPARAITAHAAARSGAVGAGSCVLNITCGPTPVANLNI